MVVMLRQCCCGCSLKTGTLIIGVLNLIGACFGVGNGVVFSQQYPDHKTLGIVAAVFSAFLILISILLIVGAVKEKPSLLTPWIIINIIIMIATVILYIIWAVSYFKRHDNGSGASYIVAAIIYALLETYFILVVYSLYRELKGTA